MFLKLRATPEWARWLDGLAAHCRVTTTTAIEQAVYRYAEGVGYHRPAPRRLPTPRRGPAVARRVAAELREHHDDHQADGDRLDWEVDRVREQLVTEGRATTTEVTIELPPDDDD